MSGAEDPGPVSEWSSESACHLSARVVIETVTPEIHCGRSEIRRREHERPDRRKNLIESVNGIRRGKSDRRLRFRPSDNHRLLCFSKTTEKYDNVVLMAFSLDPHHTPAGRVELDTAELGLASAETNQVHDWISGSRHLWSGVRNSVELDPRVNPAHVFRVRRHVRTERDFDYFL